MEWRDAILSYPCNRSKLPEVSCSDIGRNSRILLVLLQTIARGLGARNVMSTSLLSSGAKSCISSSARMDFHCGVTGIVVEDYFCGQRLCHSSHMVSRAVLGAAHAESPDLPSPHRSLRVTRQLATHLSKEYE